MISQVEPQKIVERLNNILYKNINIFNTKGIIVASNDVSRIGEYHSAAKECVDHRSIVTISQENKNDYTGCKEGINLPVLYEGTVIGAVGITGDPGQVRGYGLIVKELIEHIYHENSTKSSDALYQEMVKLFFFELFRTTSKESLEDFEKKAKSLKIDYIGCSLVACVFDDVKSLIAPDVPVQNSISSLVSYLRQNLGYCFTLYDNRILVIARKTYILDKKLIDLHHDIMKKFGVSVTFIHTSQCKHLSDYPVQYTLIRSMSRFQRIQIEGKPVYSTSELQEFFLLENLDPEYRKGYLSFYKRIFTLEKQPSSTLLQTVKQYFENDLSIKATALALEVHRNTIVYRLQQFMETYDIDVYSATSCMRLYLAILMFEMEQGK